MPSKSTFALVALLAATSVSALPTRGTWVDLVERGPNTPVAVPATGAVVPVPAAGNNPPAVGPPAVGSPAVVPPASVLAQSPVSGTGSTTGGTGAHQHQHPHRRPHRRLSQHSTDGSSSTHNHGNGHPTRHRSHDNKVASTDGTTTPHNKHHHRHPSAGSAVTTPVNSAAGPLTPPAGAAALSVTPPTQATTLTRREFYESLYTRDPDHPNGHHHHHHHHPHHHHPHPQDQQQQQQPTPQADPNAAPPLQSRELLERRGLLETLGLKARVSNLTVKQTEQMTKAKTVCGGLASKKDQHTCHKNVDKIIQLTKERNYDVEQFIKLTNHHDVFSSSDPSLTSSSSPSLSSHF